MKSFEHYEEKEEFLPLNEEETHKENKVKQKIIYPEQIGDFWMREIEGFSVDEVMLEIYISTKDGLRKYDYFTEDERALPNGAIKPPLYLEELKAIGPGKYLIRLRHMKTGKILGVQTIKIAPEADVADEKPIETRPVEKSSIEAEIYKQLLEQNRMLLEKMLSVLVEKKPQENRDTSFDALKEAFTKGLEIASNIKSKEIEAQLEEIRSKREIELKRMEQEHEIRKLKLQEGVSVGDVLDKLEEQGKEKEKNTFLDFIFGITNALDKLNQFVSSLGLGQGGNVNQEPFRKHTEHYEPSQDVEVEEEEFAELFEEQEDKQEDEKNKEVKNDLLNT